MASALKPLAVSNATPGCVPAAICAALGKAAEDFIKHNLALLTIAFIVLIIGGFVAVRLVARRAARKYAEGDSSPS